MEYAIKKMFKRKQIIIPTLRMKFAVYGSRLIPAALAIMATGHQQKKKIYR